MNVLILLIIFQPKWVTIKWQQERTFPTGRVLFYCTISWNIIFPFFCLLNLLIGSEIAFLLHIIPIPLCNAKNLNLSVKGAFFYVHVTGNQCYLFYARICLICPRSPSCSINWALSNKRLIQGQINGLYLL